MIWHLACGQNLLTTSKSGMDVPSDIPTLCDYGCCTSMIEGLSLLQKVDVACVCRMSSCVQEWSVNH